MINKELIDYLKQQLQSDETKEKISKDLISNGWTMVDVEEGFRALDSTPNLSSMPASVPVINPAANSVPEQRSKNSLFTNLWLWWFVLTTIYIVIQMVGVNVLGEKNIFPSIMGLFVPVGPLSLMGIQLSLLSGLSGNFETAVIFIRGISGILFMFIALYLGNKFINKIIINKIFKITTILVYLFFLTIVVDLIIWGAWSSMSIVLTGEPSGLFTSIKL